jgi:hypothetical protein
MVPVNKPARNRGVIPRLAAVSPYRGCGIMAARVIGIFIVVMAAAIVFVYYWISLPQEVFIHGQGRI